MPTVLYTNWGFFFYWKKGEKEEKVKVLAEFTLLFGPTECGDLEGEESACLHPSPFS